MPLQAPSNFAPNDYTAEQQSIENQRRLALALQQQGQTPLDPAQQAGGWVIPVSPYAGAAKMVQSFGGSLGQRQADERERTLAEKYRSDLSSALVNAQQAAAGTPGHVQDTSQEGTGSFDMSGTRGPANVAAVAPSRDKMIQALMSHPATQPLAMQEFSRGLAMDSVFGPQGASGGA